MASRVRRVAASVALSLVGAAACSSGDGTDLAVVPATAAVTITTGAANSGVTSTDGPPTVEPSRPATSVVTSVAPGDTGVTTDTESTTASTGPILVDETGVPGLDADDDFCRAWSRFGGSFQVVAVNAAFGAGGDQRLAALELVAAPTTGIAYMDLRRTWPDEIEAEYDAAIFDVFGPFASRAGAARTALIDAGLGSAEMGTLQDAWLQALATRRSDDPEVVIDLPDDVWEVVDRAAILYLDEVGPWSDDETLVTDVEIPLTNQYLAANCPDQGVLAGQEVTGEP